MVTNPPARSIKEHDMRTLAMAIIDKGVELEDLMDNYFVADADGHFVSYTEDLTALEDPRDAALVQLDGKTGKEVADAYRADEDLKIADAVVYYEDDDEWDERMGYTQLLALLDAHMAATVRFVLYRSE